MNFSLYMQWRQEQLCCLPFAKHVSPNPTERGGWVAGEEIVIKVRLSTTSKDIKLPVHSLDTIAECKQLLKVILYSYSLMLPCKVFFRLHFFLPGLVQNFVQYPMGENTGKHKKFNKKLLHLPPRRY
jgi:hypothetical protein